MIVSYEILLFSFFNKFCNKLDLDSSFSTLLVIQLFRRLLPVFVKSLSRYKKFQ